MVALGSMLNRGRSYQEQNGGGGRESGGGKEPEGAVTTGVQVKADQGEASGSVCGDSQRL